MLQKLHHVAYRCTSAVQTVDFYTRLLGLELVHALTNDYVPSVKQYSPHLHIFFAMEGGSYIAFFEVPIAAPAQKDPNTPAWVQHLALEVKDMDTLLAGKQRLEKAGVEVIGPTDHGFCKSIYFFDPSGHRLELTVRCEQPGELEKFKREAAGVVSAWQQRAARENWPSAREAAA